MKINHRSEIFLIIFSCIAVYAVVWAFTGEWPWVHNPYNSYILQARAWLNGHIDLGRNYEHLELAVYKGKYFVSFPPFPSAALIPFALSSIPDNFAAAAVSAAACVFAWRLCKSFSNSEACFLALFLSIASNVMVVSINSWVWFIAQNLSFLLTLMGFYYARVKKGTAALAALACAVLCRPFQILYFPMLILILTEGRREKDAWRWLIIPVALGISAMVYNFARFGNPLEFGHNYLPEFTEAAKGQFDISYIPQNVKSLVRLPQAAADGRLIFPEFNGMSVFICSPILIFCMLFSLSKINRVQIAAGILTLAVHVLLILSHKTMGGYHFGNRYMIDIMPCLFYMLLYSFPKNERIWKDVMTPFFLFGLCINTVGTINMFLNG